MFIEATQIEKESSKNNIVSRFKAMSSAYERQREQNIRRNAAKLRELGLDDTKGAKVALSGLSETELAALGERKNAKIKRKRKRTTPAVPSRRSARARKLPAPSYAPPSSFIEDEREDRRKQLREEKAKGYRLSNGRWRGEKYGHVKGVSIGHVFGKGDYQRLGRTEMSKTGFFKPFVTPEWCEPKGACYSLIVGLLSRCRSVRGKTAGSLGKRKRIHELIIITHLPFPHHISPSSHSSTTTTGLARITETSSNTLDPAAACEARIEPHRKVFTSRGAT